MLRFKTKVIDLSKPIVMGILNLTPDSFFDGGNFTEEHKAITHTQDLIKNGASIIDIGAYSTRPGAPFVEEEEELNRLSAILPVLLKKFPDTIFSLDTFRSKVAEYAIGLGVEIINDVSGGKMDSNMHKTIVKHNVYYVLMHMRGTLATMQEHTSYKNVTQEVCSEIKSSLSYFEAHNYEKIILDPGFGFSKTLDQNYELLSNLKQLKKLNFPILVGISRKSMIWKHLSIEAKEALNGTSVLNTFSLLQGANILRVHDVKEAKETILLTEKLI